MIKSKIYTCLIVTALPISCYAHGGLGSLAFLAMAFYFGLIAITVLFILVAFFLRKKEKLRKWQILTLLAPSALVGIFFLLCVPAALYQNMGIDSFWLAIVGAINIYVCYKIFSSYRRYHEIQV